MGIITASVFSWCWGAILFIPIHFFIEQLGWGCRGCAEGFRLVGTEEKGSFEEVTDGARGTGQRKFARCWNRAADQTFPPAAPWIGINGCIGGGSFCFLSKRAAIVGNNLLSLGLKKKGVGGDHRGISSGSQAPLFPSFPRVFSEILGIRNGKGAGTSRSGAHGKPGRGGEASVWEAPVCGHGQRVFWDRWKRQ